MVTKFAFLITFLLFCSMKNFSKHTLLFIVMTMFIGGVSYAKADVPKANGIENINYHPPSVAEILNNNISIEKFCTEKNFNQPECPAQTLITCDNVITTFPDKGYASVMEVNTVRSEEDLYCNRFIHKSILICKVFDGRNGRNPRDGLRCTQNINSNGYNS